jgi:hypothetical protein
MKSIGVLPVFMVAAGMALSPVAACEACPEARALLQAEDCKEAVKLLTPSRG